MTVRIGKMTFSDWVSLPFQGGWSDTFIFRIDAHACIPPFDYAPLLKRLVAATRKIRSSASIWVQVDALGEWYLAEVKRSLHGLALPYAVTPMDEKLEYLDFSFRPKLLYAPPTHPPIVKEDTQSDSQEELRCLQALSRMKKGNEHEVASLAGLQVDVTKKLLDDLAARNLVIHKTSPKIKRGRKSSQLDLFPLWHTRAEGLSIALRSWGVPKGTEFTSRHEENLQQIGNEHRHISRIWSLWLKSAWPQAEIWAGWSEVGIPGLSVIPDGLAWGRIQGYETLFWLEVGDQHKSRNKISEITINRLAQALQLCKRTGVRLVYAQLSTKWVQEVIHWSNINLSDQIAVVLANQKKFGELPPLEWGKLMK
jgi:hypothetical protein